MTDKERQTEELARVICDGCTECKRIMCHEWYVAQKIYNAGYRKQVEGEWEDREGERWIGSEVCERYHYYSCSICGRKHDLPDSYCPQCGTKMKGGESE